MANRHLIRSIVLQTLFEWDFNKYEKSRADELFEKNMKEFGAGLEAEKDSYGRRLLHKVLEEKEKLDKIIEKAAPQWPIDQISAVDRNVLRIGLCELLFFDRREVPPKVAINEAVEIAKNFGGASSGRFVNGVLGTVYREMGEPDANAEPLKEELAGAVVYRRSGDEILFALVHDIFGYWTLSKGKVGEGEDLKLAVRQRIKEEIGIDIEVEKELGENKYIASEPERGKVEKKVRYFLARALGEELKLKETGGLDGARWFKMEELKDLKIYDDIKKILVKAIKVLSVKQ